MQFICDCFLFNHLLFCWFIQEANKIGYSRSTPTSLVVQLAFCVKKIDYSNHLKQIQDVAQINHNARELSTSGKACLLVQWKCQIAK